MAKEEVTRPGDMTALQSETGRGADRTGEGSEGAAGEHEPGDQAPASVGGRGVRGARDVSPSVTG